MASLHSQTIKYRYGGKKIVFVSSKVFMLNTYEESPRESTSRVSTCHFFGSLLKSLLSFYHVQSG